MKKTKKKKGQRIENQNLFFAALSSGFVSFRLPPRRTVSHINLIEQKFEILTLAACNRQNRAVGGRWLAIYTYVG